MIGSLQYRFISAWSHTLDGFNSMLSSMSIYLIQIELKFTIFSFSD